MDAKEIQAQISRLKINQGDLIVVTKSTRAWGGGENRNRSEGRFISYDGAYLLYQPSGEKGRKSVNYMSLSDLEKI
jgi:hypothetical protein